VRVLLVLVATFSSAFAVAAPTAQDRERARGFMDLGDEKTAAGELEGALKAYQAADGIMSVPTTGLEVGRTLEKLGRLIEARDAFVRVARFPREAGESPVFTTARDKAAELANALGARIPSLTLKHTGLPSGVRPDVVLDGNPLQKELLGLPMRVNPGKVLVRATAPGFLPLEREAMLAERETKEIELAFQADPNAPAALPAHEETPAPNAPRTQEAPSRTAMWIAFGVGAAGIVTGSVTGLMSLSKTDAAKKTCDGNHCPEAAAKDIETAKTLAHVSNAGFAVGVLGAGIGVWQFFSASPDAPEKSAGASGFRAEARVGVGSVSVAGTF
jgi:hypothetical protein